MIALKMLLMIAGVLLMTAAAGDSAVWIVDAASGMRRRRNPAETECFWNRAC